MSEPTERFSRYAHPGEDGPDLGLYIQAMTEDAKAFFETQKELTMLEVSERAGVFAGKLVLFVILGLVACTVLVFWFIALALWLGRLLQDPVLGFLAAGALFLVLGALYYLVWRAFLKDRIALAVINAMHAKD